MKRLCLAMLALAAACGGSPGRAPTLEEDFQNASAEYRVPVKVLEGIGFVETKWQMHRGEMSIDHGYGVMRLLERDDADQVGRAAALTGYSREELKTDPQANIRGAAAVLREYADRVFENGSLHEENLADWFEVVTHYAGITDLRVAELYGIEVFEVIRAGASRKLSAGERLTLPATAVDVSGKVRFVNSLRSLRIDGPADHWVAASSSNYTAGRGGNAVHWIVIHTTQGSYAGTISWFQNPSAQVSAHYVVAQSGDSTQMVSVNDTAWHAGNWSYNQQSVGIEHEGYITTPGWPTEAMYQKSAAISTWLCNHFGIPKKHVPNQPGDGPGLIGHIEVPGATHTDPGQYWDWNHYISLINGGTTSTTGQLDGVVYVNPDTTNRIAGATIQIQGGPSATSDANGAFQLDLPAGAYTYTVSKSGYQSATLSRTVTAGQVVWGSVGLAPVQVVNKGCLWGATFLGAYPDKTSPLPATDTLTPGGQTLTPAADSNGYYTFKFNDLDAGQNYTVSITYQGKTYSQTRNIATACTSTPCTCTSANATWGSIWVDTTTNAKPLVSITSPLPPDPTSASPAAIPTNLEVVSITGTATATAGVSKVTIANKTTGASADASYDAGSSTFSGNVTLAAGDNVVDVTATDANGATSAVSRQQTSSQGISEITLTFTGTATGVDGTVVDSSTKAPLSGASLSLGNGANDVTGADGHFSLSLTPTDPAGAYTLVATAPGYRPYTNTITLTDGARSTVEIDLVKAPDIVFISPDPAKPVVNSDRINVAGQVSYDDVLSVALSVDTGYKGAAETGAGSTFSGPVTLKPGQNVITATATVCTARDSTAACAASTTVTGKLTVNLTQVKGGGCGCGTTAPGMLAFVLLPLAALRRRRRELAA